MEHSIGSPGPIRDVKRMEVGVGIVPEKRSVPVTERRSQAAPPLSILLSQSIWNLPPTFSRGGLSCRASEMLDVVTKTNVP